MFVCYTVADVREEPHDPCGVREEPQDPCGKLLLYFFVFVESCFRRNVGGSISVFKKQTFQPKILKLGDMYLNPTKNRKILPQNREKPEKNEFWQVTYAVNPSI